MASIHILDPVVASRIAAGEVVERPASVLRELLDNSIDAGAKKISVYLEEGGISRLTVTDNGRGMSEDDLLLACTSHATSKVSTLEDLFSLRTLGFRGEALSSIAACSRLTIDSNGSSVTVDNGIRGPLVPGSTSHGTSVTMEDLFANIPARKLFLKRPQSEGAECRKTLTEKALGFEKIEFLFFTDGNLVLHLPATDRKGRCLQIMGLERSFAGAAPMQMSYEGENAKLFAVCSDPGTYRRDRAQIRILVNNRIIDSFQLVQAVTSAYSAALPGGAFPFFYLFIEDNPALVDFNIHPSKRECRIRNQSQIYGALTTMVRKALTDLSAGKMPAPKHIQPEFLDDSAVAEMPSDPYIPRQASHGQERPAAPEKPVEKTTPKQTSSKPAPAQAKPFDPTWFDNARAIMAKTRAEKMDKIKKPAATVSTTEVVAQKEEVPFKYIGQAFNTFLVVEQAERIVFIDQHALHERLLYDEIKALKDVQRLIVPYSFEVDRSVDDFLLENSLVYSEFGIELTRREPLLWEMDSLPAACRKSEEQVAQYIRTQTGDLESIRKGLFAVIACHAAIKAGDELDSVTANELVKKCFALERTVCPHGREFTFTISKEELYKQVGRTV